MVTDTAQRVLRKALQADILPSARAGLLHPILAQPLLAHFDGIPVLRKVEPLLAKPEKHPMAALLHE